MKVYLAAGAVRQDDSTAVSPPQSSFLIGLGAVSALLGRIQEAFQSATGATGVLKPSEADQDADPDTIQPRPKPFRQQCDASSAASGSATSTNRSLHGPASSVTESKETMPDEQTLAQEVWAVAWQGNNSLGGGLERESAARLIQVTDGASQLHMHHLI